MCHFRVVPDVTTTQNQYHLSKTPIFHQIHSKFWLIFGSFWLHFRLIGLLLPHFSLLPQHDKRFVQRHPERCVAVWQQIYENKNFSRTRARQRGHVFTFYRGTLGIFKAANWSNSRENSSLSRLHPITVY